MRSTEPCSRRSSEEPRTGGHVSHASPSTRPRTLGARQPIHQTRSGESNTDDDPGTLRSGNRPALPRSDVTRLITQAGRDASVRLIIRRPIERAKHGVTPGGCRPATLARRRYAYRCRCRRRAWDREQSGDNPRTPPGFTPLDTGQASGRACSRDPRRTERPDEP